MRVEQEEAKAFDTYFLASRSEHIRPVELVLYPGGLKSTIYQMVRGEDRGTMDPFNTISLFEKLSSYKFREDKNEIFSFQPLLSATGILFQTLPYSMEPAGENREYQVTFVPFE